MVRTLGTVATLRHQKRAGVQAQTWCQTPVGGCLGLWMTRADPICGSRLIPLLRRGPNEYERGAPPLLEIIDTGADCTVSSSTHTTGRTRVPDVAGSRLSRVELSNNQSYAHAGTFRMPADE